MGSTRLEARGLGGFCQEDLRRSKPEVCGFREEIQASNIEFQEETPSAGGI